jgi:hypothetical protein
VSNKDFIGEAINREQASGSRVSHAAAVICIMNGARIVRMHDSLPAVDAVRLNEAGTDSPPAIRATQRLMVAVRIDSLFPSAGSDLSDEIRSSLYARADRSNLWLRVNSRLERGWCSDDRRGVRRARWRRRSSVFDLLRELCDVVIVGAGTVRGEGYGPMVLPPPSVDRAALLGSRRIRYSPSCRID